MKWKILEKIFLASILMSNPGPTFPHTVQSDLTNLFQIFKWYSFMNDLLLFLTFRVLNFYFAGLAHNFIFFFFNQLLPFILVNLIINPLFYELLINLINMLVYFYFFDFINELMQNIFQPGTLSHILLPNSAHH